MDDITRRKLDAAKDALFRADQALGEVEIALPDRHHVAEAARAMRSEIALTLRQLYVPVTRA